MDRSNLAFLDKILGSDTNLYRESKWLTSDFDDDIWCFDMKTPNVGSFNIDFNLILSNGTNLTEESNKRLLKTFKYWINASTHPDNTRGRGFAYADGTAKNIILKVINLIDFFLINDKYIKLSTCGFQALTEDHLKLFLDKQAKNKRIAEHVYAWSEKLSEFLINKVTCMEFEDLFQRTLPNGIDFTFISSGQLQNNSLLIPDRLIPRIRFWLWINNLYRRGQGVNGQYKYVVNTLKLSELVYESCSLRGAVTPKPCPEILNLGEVEFNRTEYPRVPLKNEDDEKTSFTGINDYKMALRAINLLNNEVFQQESLLLPRIDIINNHLRFIPENMVGNHYRTLPSQVVLDSVRNGIEFHLKYSEALISSLKNLLNKTQEKLAVKKYTSTSTAKIFSGEEFISLLHPTMRDIGVEKWTISKEKSYFKALRSNKGLGELIRIYFGSVQIVIGSIMARRQAEIANLTTDGCLDETKEYLVFRKAKSSKLLAGSRVEVARPIDEMAVQMIEKLIEIRQIYLELGFVKNSGYIFDAVSLNNATKLVSVQKNHHAYARNMDLFCDYFETPLVDGERFYIRTHQLRRFFALSFFWGSGFGGMDTLRWFMGHTDLQHLYHYITEITPGEVLQSVKSQFLSETINEHTELRELISERYGTVDFTILNKAELEEYLNDLILSKEVDVEPEFIQDDNGQTYKLIVIIREKHHG